MEKHSFVKLSISLDWIKKVWVWVFWKEIRDGDKTFYFIEKDSS